jgi:hypothetical protein
LYLGTVRTLCRIGKVRRGQEKADRVNAIFGVAQNPTFRAPKKLFAAMGAEKDGSAALGLLLGFDRQEELLKAPASFSK